MPNVWTHSIYGEILLERLSLSSILNGDSTLAPLFRFGCQGPDPLFYHRFYPWMKTTSVRSDALGGLLHKSRCGAFLKELLHGCAGAAPNDPRAVYALGWLAHHALDRIAHPFVFARQGDKKRDHQRLETAIDTYVAERLRGIDTRRTPVRPTLDAGRALPAGVAELVEGAVRRAFPEQDSPFIDGLWQRSYRDMLAAFSLFHDPSGAKTKLLAGAIEPFVPGRRDAALDPMNERRAEWRPPADETKTSRESFWDVWERALDDGERLLGAAHAWLVASRDADRAEDAWRAFEEALGDLSYETGLAADR